jgi:hypothetical protein
VILFVQAPVFSTKAVPKGWKGAGYRGEVLAIGALHPLKDPHFRDGVKWKVGHVKVIDAVV